MDAAEFDLRARGTYTDWIPSELVGWLVEHGHLDQVQREARAGDWYCTRAWVEQLVAEDRREEAFAVLAPHVEAGSWSAAHEYAELLERWGPAEEAIAFVRRQSEAGVGKGSAFEYLTRLLARHGRAEEAYELLRPYIRESQFAAALVAVTEGLGRDEEVAALLAARVEAPAERWPSVDLGTPEPHNAVELLAAVRERQGRVEEAIALLRTRSITSVNGRDELADLLARHDRVEELRAYMAEDPREGVVHRLAELLEARGDVAGAVDAYRACAVESPHHAVGLAELLVRHGRGAEAIEVLRALPRSSGGDEDWIVDTLCTLYIDQQRVEEGLAYLDGVLARVGSPEWEYFRLRPRLLAACGRRDQAIEEVRAHPDADSPFVVKALAEMIAEAGRLEEAVELLDPARAWHRQALAVLLMKLGRIDEAVAVFRLPQETVVIPRVLGLPWSADGPPPF
ncbi:tetratricopeptide repeat protein [Kitasatospora sp. NPDC001132]